MTLYLFNRLIRVATYLRKSGNKTIRVKSFQRKANPLLNMPPGKIRLNKPDGHIGKEVVIDTDGTLREALTELSDLPFVPKLIASKGDRLLIERPLITKDRYLGFDSAQALKYLYKRGYMSRNMDVGYGADGRYIIRDPIKGSSREMQVQYEKAGGFGNFEDRVKGPPPDYIDIEKQGLISPLELVKPKIIEFNTNVNNDEVLVNISPTGEISFTVNESITAGEAAISSSPIELGKAVSRQVKKAIKEQEPNTLVYAVPYDKSPVKQNAKRRTYQRGGLSTEYKDGSLWGLINGEGRITGKGLSPQYLDQIRTMWSRLIYKNTEYSGKKIRDIYKWE